MHPAVQPRRANWFTLSFLGGAGSLFRRADVHPDAPPRPPLSAARDLALPEPVTKPDLPADRDPQTAAVDTPALFELPQPAPAPARPLSRPALIDPGDRIEIFELTPIFTRPAGPYTELESFAAPVPAPVVPEPLPMIGPETAATVNGLLARLERDVKERAATAASPGSDENA